MASHKEGEEKIKNPSLLLAVERMVDSAKYDLMSRISYLLFSQYLAGILL